MRYETELAVARLFERHAEAAFSEALDEVIDYDRRSDHAADEKAAALRDHARVLGWRSIQLWEHRVRVKV